jgi:hypothetical protein
VIAARDSLRSAYYSLSASALVSAIVLGGCAKPRVASEPAAPTPAFEMRAGELRAFAGHRSICVDASEQETEIDLTTVAVSVLTRELPGFSNSCGASRESLLVTFQTGRSVYTHGPVRGPRFGFGHVGRRGSRGEFIAEADVWDRTCSNREECIQKVAMMFANFLKAANIAARLPNPVADVAIVVEQSQIVGRVRNSVWTESHFLRTQLKS